MSVGPDPVSALRAARDRIDRKSVWSRVATELRRQIDDGQLPPGMRLGEESIADALGVSRNTVREAFTELAGERLVERIPNRGVFVRSPSREDVIDVYRMRRIIECGALVEGGDAATVKAMRLAVEQGRRAVAKNDRRAILSANLRFHQAIVAMGRCSRLNQQVGILLAETRLFLHAAADEDSYLERFLDRNDEICTLVESGRYDEAATALKDYLVEAEADLLRFVGDA